MSFGTRLAEAMDARGPVCFGIDPHPGLLDGWGLSDDAEGLAAFADTVLEACGDVGAAIKPQSAFFERHGSRGVAVLERLLADASAQGVLTILDVKRGDIGSTMSAYAEAYLMDGSPLAADAITVSPYLGPGALAPAFELAHRAGRGVFVLCVTSNPEGADVQHASLEGRSVAARVAEAVAHENAEAVGLGSIGLVVGATTASATRELGRERAGPRARARPRDDLPCGALARSRPSRAARGCPVRARGDHACTEGLVRGPVLLPTCELGD
jgi:orotidine-5'-phosphate decarboxylase